MDGSPKVKRWKMEIQEYDFHVEHIEGVDNHIADTLSRLCYIGEEEVLAYRNAVNLTLKSSLRNNVTSSQPATTRKLVMVASNAH